MASINGIELKGLKEFKGHEQEPLTQGNIYYKGKKLVGIVKIVMVAKIIYH